MDAQAGSRSMCVRVFTTPAEMGAAVAAEGAKLLRRAIEVNGQANMIVATGASQFDFLESFVTRDVDFSKVNMFHLDEYVGLPESHPASFRGYLRERLTERVSLKSVYFVDADRPDPEDAAREVSEQISQIHVDVAFVGIGENGHLAFNAPPADFETTQPYIVVQLDEACRRQQVGEGWFESLDDVPTRAISMSVREILRAGAVLCTCPDRRKAEAVRNTLDGPITPDVPASILRIHPDCRFFLDTESASLLMH